MLKKYKGYIIFFYVAAFLSLIVASFKDLAIDIALNNPTNPIALWFYRTGEVPGNIILTLGGAVIFYCSGKRLLRLIGLAAELIGGVVLGVTLAGYMFIKDGSETVTGVLFGLGVSVLFLLAGKYIVLPDKMKKPLLIFAWAGIAAMLVKTGIIEITKIFWGRERYRMMLELGTTQGFTQWYQPQGITSSNEYKSFPSGHTAGAGMSYLAMLLPFAGDKLKGKYALCFAVPFAYTSVVAFTRLVMGAHFLSDVTIGGIVAFTVVIITISILDNINNKKSTLGDER